MARRKYRGYLGPSRYIVQGLKDGLLVGVVIFVVLLSVPAVVVVLDQWVPLSVLDLVLSLVFVPWFVVAVVSVPFLFLGLMLRLVLELVQQKPWEKLTTKVPSARLKNSLLACILLEEYRADLNTLRHRWIVKQKLPKWLVNIRTCLFLLVVFKGWLQIKCESLFLPNNRRS